MNLLKPTWPAPTTIHACTTTRNEWGNIEPITVAERLKLTSMLQLPQDPIWVKQTHSTLVCEALLQNTDQIADATFTNQHNQVCVILTADCLPILICNRQGTHIAAIHAGWRGLAAGIIENTLTALAQPASDLMVWLGPAIGPEKFEVGVDVYTAFTDSHSEATKAFVPLQNEKWLANLYQLATLRLNAYGISDIYGGTFCTYTQDDLFYSYRREQGKTGRMASLIWIS